MSLVPGTAPGKRRLQDSRPSCTKPHRRFLPWHRLPTETTRIGQLDSWFTHVLCDGDYADSTIRDGRRYLAVKFRPHRPNRRSRAAIEREGAQLDGVLRNHRVRPDGALRYTAVYPDHSV